MATKKKTKNFKSDRGELDGVNHPSPLQSIIENGLIVTIVLLCSAIDAGLFSGFAPYMILNGPTPQDSLYSNIPILLSGGIALFLCGYGLSTTFSSQVRSLMIMGAAAIKSALTLSIYLALSSGNFDGGPHSIGAYLLIHIFASISLYIAIASSKAPKRSLLFISSLLLSLEASKILYFTLLKFNPLEAPLKDTTFTCSLCYMGLLVFAGLYCMFSAKESQAVKDSTRSAKSSLKYNLTLLTVTTSLCWIPFVICLLNYATTSDSLIKLTTILSTGIIFGIGLVHLSPLKRFNLPTLTFLLTISLVLLTLSRWFVISAIALFSIGLTSSSIIKIAIQEVLAKPDQSAKSSSISVAIASLLIYSGATSLSNSAILLPSTYLMQQIGCVFFCLYLLITVSFRPSQTHLMSTIAAVLLRFKGGTGHLKETYKISTSSFIVSKMSLLKSLVISNYLSCPLIVFSNDGLINWKPICILLGFFNTTVYHTAEELTKIESQPHLYKDKPLIYIRRDSLPNKERLNSWTYLTAVKDRKSGSTIYALEPQQTKTKPKSVPYIVSTAS